MSAVVLRELRRASRAWWSHDTDAKVRRSVREKARRWRSARDAGGFAVRGHGGTTVYASRNTTWTGVHEDVEAICASLGLTFIDLTTVPDTGDLVAYSVSGPMVAAPGQVPDDPRPDGRYGSLSYAPLWWKCREAQRIGARVINPPPVGFHPGIAPWTGPRPCRDCVDVHGDDPAEWIDRWPLGAEWRAEHDESLCDGCDEERTANHVIPER